MKRKVGVIKDSLENFTLSTKWQVRIFKLGLPVAFISGIHALITMILNKLMANFGRRQERMHGKCNLKRRLFCRNISGK